MPSFLSFVGITTFPTSSPLPSIMVSTSITFVDDAYLIRDSVEFVKQSRDTPTEELVKSGLSYSLVSKYYYHPPLPFHLHYPCPLVEIKAFQRHNYSSHFNMLVFTHQLTSFGIGFAIYVNDKMLGLIIKVKSVERDSLIYSVQGERGQRYTLSVPKIFWLVISMEDHR
jgi:hypothetical protein